MNGIGTIERTAEIMSALLRGATFERTSLARTFGMTVGTADRYIRALADVPGVVAHRSGRRWLISFSYGEALRKIGR